MLMLGPACAQDIVIRNDSNIETHVEVHIWLYPPCPGASPHSEFPVILAAGTQTAIVAPPEKFLLKAFNSCDGGMSYAGERSCGGWSNSPFTCDGIAYYAASQTERLLRIAGN